MNSKVTDYKKLSSIYILKGIWKYIKKRRRVQLYLLLILMIINGFSEVISLGAVIPFLTSLTNPENIQKLPYVKKIFIDTNLINQNQLLFIFSGIFALTSLLAAIIRSFNFWLNGRLAAYIGSDLSCECYARVLHQPYKNHVNKNSSTLISAATSQIQIIVDVLRSILQLVTSSILTIFLLLGIILINWKIALFFLFSFSILYIFIAIRIRKKLVSNGSIIVDSSVKQVKAIQEGLGFIRDIILENSQSRYINIYRKSDFKQRIYTVDNLFLRAFPRFALEAFGMISIAFIATFLVISSSNSAVIPVLGAIALAAQRMLPSLQIVYSQWAFIKGSKASQATILSILDESTDFNTNKSSRFSFKNNIKLKSVSFKYDKSSENILDSINLKINKGEKIGLVGKTGSGKSTLVDIIMGLLEPVSGTLSIDEKDLSLKKNKNLLYSWRSLIAHVPQNIYLADCSIAENIALGCSIEQINFERLKDVAEKAKISEFIERNPKGFYQRVGERGLLLSGGQRQRIGIARALYQNKSFLVLDEATSALDSSTELEVMESIKGLSNDLTLLIISHRISTLNCCDRVLKIENGKLIIKYP